MRIIVFLLAILGTAGAGYFGWKLKQELDSPDHKVQVELAAALAKATGVEPPQDKTAQNMYAFFAIAGLGLIGGLLALAGRGPLAALLLIVPPLVPAALMPMAGFIPSLVFTGALILGGLLAFFIRRRPAYVPPSMP